MLQSTGMPKSLQVFILIIILAFYALTLAQPINLATADLGRHIKNGEMVSKDLAVLKTNFYSYTYPDFPFINHHWLSGVIFYLIYSLGGFLGLSLFFIFISLATFYLFFHLAWKYANFTIAALLSVVVIPLLATRSEIRPELFSYFLAGLFFWLLFNYQNKKLAFKWLWIIPVLEALWVNLHLYFALGIFLIGVFWLESFLKVRKVGGMREVREIGVILGLSLASTLLNPAFLSGALHPLHIYENYRYRVLEEQTFWFIENIMVYPPAFYFKIVLGVFLLSWFIKAKEIIKGKNIPVAVFLISAILTALGLVMVRNFALFGLFALTVTAINVRSLANLKIEMGAEYRNLVLPTTLILLILVMVVINPNFWASKNFGLGLQEGNDSAARFFLENNLQGPILNNYDIGGYLIFYLYPKHKVFVDNRPETYPGSFFQDVYIPLQENDEKWQEADQKYHFNSVFFYRRDATPWGQNFLVKKIQDPNWAPVFVDDNNIIFLKRNETNLEIIKKYGLPKSMFTVHSPV